MSIFNLQNKSDTNNHNSIKIIDSRPQINLVLVLSILCICIISIYYALPTFLSTDASNKYSTYLPDTKANLGLDLRGGASLVLEVNTAKYLKERLSQITDFLRKNLNREKMRIKYIETGDIHDEGVRFFIVLHNRANYSESDIKNKIIKIINESMDTLNPDNIFIEQVKDQIKKSNLLNKAGINQGEVWTFVINNTAIEAVEKDVVLQSIEIIRRRVDESGTKEIDVQRQGSKQILLQVPGIEDTSDIKNLIGQTAKLTFHHAMPELGEQPHYKIPIGIKFAKMQTEIKKKQYDHKQDKGNNQDKEKKAEDIIASTPSERFVAIESRPILLGEMLAEAQASVQNGKHVVNFKFNDLGAKIFADFTMHNVGKYLAILLDGRVISMPLVQQPIIGGSGVISGSFDARSAQELAVLLRAGALPAPLHIVEERTVGPSLGKSSIHFGTISIVVGGILVMCFMILFYGFWGICANLALIMNIIMIFAILGILDATLTLPGLAGIALTLGMAVDANVLIFEKMKEEKLNGLGLFITINRSYKNSIVTIMDSNITTILAALILYLLGSGPVKGFGITLIIGIISSMFTSIIVTRTLALSFYKIFAIKKLYI